MIYGPTVTAIMGLNASHDSILLKLTKVSCPVKKITFERQEIQIMSCLMELLDILPNKDREQILQAIKVEMQ